MTRRYGMALRVHGRHADRRVDSDLQGGQREPLCRQAAPLQKQQCRQRMGQDGSEPDHAPICNGVRSEARRVVSKFPERDHRQRAGTGPAAADDMVGRRRVVNGLAVAAVNFSGTWGIRHVCVQLPFLERAEEFGRSLEF